MEPLNIDEAKEHLHVRGSSQDSFIDSLIVVSRKQIERYLNRALITQQWSVFYDCWKAYMTIPLGSLQSVDSVEYYNNAGSRVTLSEATHYWVSETSDPAYILKKYGATYPELQAERPDAVKITFTCGYGDKQEDVPEDIRHAMKLLITDYFENRSDVVVGTTAVRIPRFVTDLIHTYKLYHF